MSEAAPVVLEGAAAVLAGVPADVAQRALAERCPEAAENLKRLEAARAEHTRALAALFAERFGLAYDPANGGPLVPRARHRELAEALKALGYVFYVTVCASHWPSAKTKAGEDPEHFEVATVLRTVGAGSTQVTWRVRVEVGEGLDSLFPVFAGADWQEREQWDLVGVHFDGHPDLRRLMLPDEWEGHPLRRDYAIETRCEPWR